MLAVDSPTEVDLDKVFDFARSAAIGGELPDGAARQIALVTPGRLVVTPNCPPPGSVPDEEVARFTAAFPQTQRRRFAVIAFTGVEAVLGDDLSEAIPFFGLLSMLAYTGHAVWAFEGHPTAIAAGCRGAETLLVDSAMVPHLGDGWQDAAAESMRGTDISILERDSHEWRPLWPEREVIAGLRKEANELVVGGHVDEALRVYDELDARYRDRAEPGVVDALAAALANKAGGVLLRSSRYEEAAAVCDDVLARFGDTVYCAETVTLTLILKGMALEELGHGTEAVACYDEVIDRFADYTGSAITRDVTQAFQKKAVRQIDDGRLDEALATYDLAVARLRAHPALMSTSGAAWTFANRGSVLAKLGRTEEALAAFDDAESRLAQRTDPEAVEALNAARANGRIALQQAGSATKRQHRRPKRGWRRSSRKP